MDKTQRRNQARPHLKKIPRNLCYFLTSIDLLRLIPNSVIMNRQTISRPQEPLFCSDKPNRRQDRVKLSWEAVMDTWSGGKTIVLKVFQLLHIAYASKSQAIIILPSAISSTAKFRAQTSTQVRWIVLKTSSKSMTIKGKMASNTCSNQSKASKNCKRKLARFKKPKLAAHETKHNVQLCDNLQADVILWDTY